LVSLGSEDVGDEVDRRVDRLARIVVRLGASIVRLAGGVRAEWSVWIRGCRVDLA
jgi:hypothetical protein